MKTLKLSPYNEMSEKEKSFVDEVMTNPDNIAIAEDYMQGKITKEELSEDNDLLARVLIVLGIKRDEYNNAGMELAMHALEKKFGTTLEELYSGKQPETPSKDKLH